MENTGKDEQKQKSASNKIVHKENISCMPITIFLICVMFSVFMLFALFLFDLQHLFTPFLGKHAVAILFIFLGLCAISPLYLLVVRNKKLRLRIMTILTISFIVFFFASSAISSLFFRDFTTDKWLKYPQNRNRMLDDLIDNHGIIGMEKNGVLELLGEPDAKNETVYSYYMNRQFKDRVYIEITFINGKVISAVYQYLL